jgi:hypothetical protein
MDLFVPFAKAPLSNTPGILAILMPLGRPASCRKVCFERRYSRDRIAHPQKWV